MDGEVTLVYDNIQHKIDLDDLSPENIGVLFNLDFEVKILKEVTTGKTLFLKNKNKFKPNTIYAIENPTGPLPTVKEQPEVALSSWSQQNYEIVQQALVLSKAVYEENAADYLRSNLRSHNIGAYLRSQHGDCHFLLAEEMDTNRLYIAFRGTEDMRDITEDLRIYPRAVDSVSGRPRAGSFHSGFLNRAQLFPLQAVLTAKRFAGKQFVLCGHSLGGAIAAIVTAELLIERQKQGGTSSQSLGSGEVLCITFGAPLFGDVAARQFLTEKRVAASMFHFVAAHDPVPGLLSFAQSVSAVKHRLDDQIRSVAGAVAPLRGQTSSDLYTELLERKERCITFLAALGPLVEPLLSVAALLSPARVGTAKAIVDTIRLVSETVDSCRPTEFQRIYMPIGNFLFLKEDTRQPEVCGVTEYTRVETALDNLREVGLNDSLPAHQLDGYMRMAARAGLFDNNQFSQDRIVHAPFMDMENVLVFPRQLEEITEFRPEVQVTELYVLTGGDKLTLRLALIGINLAHVCLQDSRFCLGFPFGQEGKATVKRIPQGGGREQLVVEQQIPSTDLLSISDHGAPIVLATQFGSCEFLLPKNRIRNVELQSMSQVCRHESITVLIRKAVQRGMALAQLRDSGFLQEPLIRNIFNLAELCLPQAEFRKYEEMFRNERKNIQFILSNEEEYKKVSDFCDRIQDYVMSPLQIQAEKSVVKKIAIGAFAVMGGAAFAYMAGPGLLLIGAIEAFSVSGVAAAGTFGTVGTGLLAHRFFTEALADQNYSRVLKWLTSELYHVFSTRMKDTIPEAVQKVSDLRDDDTVYSDEMALLHMFQPGRKRGNARVS